MKLFPREQWDILSHTLIFHGRRICTARAPACAACPVSDPCPSAFKAENVGRKPPRNRNGNGKPAAKKRAAKAKPAKKKTARKAR
jgi:endonuclease-3